MSAGSAEAELEQLRRWKDEALEVLNGWEKVHDALGKPATPGQRKSEASLAAVEHLTGTEPSILLPSGVVETCRLTVVSYITPEGAGGYAVGTRGSAQMLTYLGMTVIAQDQIKEWGSE